MKKLRRKNLEKAFDHINKVCYGNVLPPVVLTVYNSKKNMGLFKCTPFIIEETGQGFDIVEIKLSRIHHKNKRQVVGAMAHEMRHYWQCLNGKALNHGKKFKRACRKDAKLLGFKPSEII